MIGEIIDILEAATGVMSHLSGASDIHAIQRRQNTGLPCIVVDLTNFEPEETKSHSSFIDYVTIQVTAYAKDPKGSYTIAMAIRNELDKYVGTVNHSHLDIRFEDLEVGISPDDETFATVSSFVVTTTRTGLSAHT
jgi:hypothetical protein|tara:strand:+ start:244 stop:651 length:408 start_codon:yes stop_codon:yes gene_type:complete